MERKWFNNNDCKDCCNHRIDEDRNLRAEHDGAIEPSDRNGNTNIAGKTRCRWNILCIYINN